MSSQYLQSLTSQELLRQKSTLNLIASENYPSPATLDLMGSVWSNKYGEGYPGKRYYAGNVFTDELEEFVQNKALEVYGCGPEYGVNVQVLSGSPANAMVYLSVLDHGDTIMSLKVSNGGHISHLHPTSSWNKFFNLVNYDVVETQTNHFQIDLDDFANKLKQFSPKLVIIGFSAYPKKYEFAEMIKLAHSHGAFVLADIAHINGLVAAGLHDSPFGVGVEYADFVSMTTHKTFRGPRGALLFAKNHIPNYLEHQFSGLEKLPKSLIEMVNKTVFPGTSGGPHFQQIAAVGQACLEILGECKYPDAIDFKTYSQRTLENTKALENSLKQSGLQPISETQTHLCLIKLPAEMDSIKVQIELENIGIIANRNSVPFDNKTAWRPSGLRFGMAALTSRGISMEQSKEIGEVIAQCIFKQTDESILKTKVQNITSTLNWWYQ